MPAPLFEQIAEGIRQQMAVLEEPREFIPGKTRIPLNVPTYGAPEVIEALDSLMSTWVTMGKKVKNFEAMFADYVGPHYGIMVNSGSSANLLALSVLGLKPGDEVITPALTWATSVFPIIQLGAVPVLVDVERDSYNVDPWAIESAITPRTKAIMPVHLLGNPCDMDAITQIATEFGLSVMEDSCEAHGAEYHGRKVGSFGDISTFSFFFSHHISTIEGGMILTDNEEYVDQLRSLRAHGWIRDMSNRVEIADNNPEIDPRFMFAHVGYNFRPTEIQGAFGIHQLPRLDGFIDVRRGNAAYFNKALAPYEKWLMLPSEAPHTRHAHFAYPFLVRENAPFSRNELMQYLESKGVEARPIEAGNIAIQPAMKKAHYHVSGSLANAQYIHDQGFFIGNHNGVGPEQREAIVSYLREFFEGK